MGNIWDGPPAKRQNPKNRTVKNYIHAVVYDEPIDYHDKNRPKHLGRRGSIQIVRKKGVMVPAQNAPPPDRGHQKRGVRKRMMNREKKFPKPPVIDLRSPEKRKGLKKKTVIDLRSPEKRKALKKKTAKPQVINLDDQTPDEKKEQIPESSKLNERVERAMKRTDKLEKALPLKKKRLLFQPVLMPGIQRRLLFCNPGDESIQLAHYAVVKQVELPKWAKPFRMFLSADDDTLYFQIHERDLPFAWSSDKRKAVKLCYFHPKMPSTIQPITDELRSKFCNISKRDVTAILRSLETYQLNFARRRPPHVLGRMNLSQPGILACDMFFPSKTLGWRKMNCLSVMDTWSRFVRCYALPKKDLKSQEAAFTLFMNEFTALGHIPRRMLADKGTDLNGAKTVMEKYRLARDKNGPMVLHSATGTPINIIEAINSQLQRRMQVFRTAGLTDDPSVLLTDICDQINNQKRPDRGNLTPLQLLALTAAERHEVNKIYTDRTMIPEVTGLQTLHVGNLVRILKMTRKEQVQNKTKGFAPKWSKHVYQVMKKLPIAKNKDHFRYYLITQQRERVTEFYYRHELLKIPKAVDRKVVRGTITHKENVVAPDENWSDLSDYGSD